MRHYYLLLFIAFSFLNCTNDDENINKIEVIGNWNWIESTGGIDGRTDTPTSTGNQIRLEISRNSIKKFVNDVEVFNLIYSIETRQSILFGENRDLIIFENDFNQTIELSENQLILFDECTDCFRNVYIRN
jgi:hypothetical protein